LHEGRLTDREFVRHFREADYVLIPYNRRHVSTSGTFGRGVRMRRKVIASDHGWVGLVVRKFRLGITVPYGDVVADADALGLACRGGPDSLQPDGPAHRV